MALWHDEIKKIEKPIIERVLRENGNIVSRSACLLGISRNKLYARIDRYDIDVRQRKNGEGDFFYDYIFYRETRPLVKAMLERHFRENGMRIGRTARKLGISKITASTYLYQYGILQRKSRWAYALEKYEKPIIERYLNLNWFSKEKACKELGISLYKLNCKIEDYNIPMNELKRSNFYPEAKNALFEESKVKIKKHLDRIFSKYKSIERVAVHLGIAENTLRKEMKKYNVESQYRK